MKNKTVPIFLILSIIILSTLACSFGGKTSEPVTQDEKAENSATAVKIENTNQNSGETESPNPAIGDSSFPVPGNTKIIQSSPEMTIATVKMAMKDVISYYRTELKQQGLIEDTLLTTINDTTFSLVFKGATNGKGTVVQGTDMSDGTIAFSVRYE